MATGNSIKTFDVSDVSEGCNYSDDLPAVTKKQSPDSLNVEFFNGRIRKRDGEMAISTPPTGQGGIDTYTKLMLHMNGTSASTTFTDSENTPKTVTANGNAQISTLQSKFGGAAGSFSGGGIDSYAVLMLHCDGVDASTTFTDSASGVKTVSPHGDAQIDTAQSKFGGASGLFDGTGDYLTVPDSADWEMGSGDFTYDFWVKQAANGSSQYFIYRNEAASGNDQFVFNINASNLIGFSMQNATDTIASYQTTSAVMLTDAFHHLALVRSGSNIYIFVDGVSQSLTTSVAIGSTAMASGSGKNLNIAANTSSVGTPGGFLNGWMDEIRITKGFARWTANFNVPIAAYSVGDYLSLADSADWNFGTGTFTIDFWVNWSNFTATPMPFSQYQDGNNFVYLQVGTGTLQFIVYQTGSVILTMNFSHTMTTGTWYHLAIIRGWAGGANTWAITQNGVSLGTATSSITYPNYAGTLNIGGFNAGASQNFTGYLDEYRISVGTARWTADFTPPSLAYDTFSATIDQIGFSLIDFSDTNDNHQQVAHIGTGVYAYDRVSSTVATLRNGAPYVRSFNAKASSYLIQTYNNYAVPYYWDGAATSMAILSANAPGFKRSIEFQGYLIGMNTAANPTRCYYQPIGNILGGGAAYTDYFTLTPAPNDDEITDPFLLYGRLYAGTKYGIFRISFVGGVTVFEFKQVISDVGIVPGTIQIVITKQFGQVALFLGTDKRVYMFDGANVKTISDLFYYSNRSTPIALDLIDDNYKENSFAVYDFTLRIYRLFVTKKADSTNNYCMNVDVDTFAYYPFDNMAFSAGCMAYDSLLRPFLLCLDYTGVIHKMFIDSPTDNGTAINEYFTSPLVSLNSNVIKKGTNINFDIVPSSNANLQVYDKIDFARAWTFRQNLPLASSRDKFIGRSFVLGSAKLGSEKELLSSQLSINATFNSYQFKLVSDTPTAAAWEINDIMVDQAILKYGKAEAQR